MRFLLDQNVANSVAETLRDLGHEVEFVRDVLAANAADQLVAAWAEYEGCVLVSHDKDFQQLAPQIPHGQNARFRRLSRIWLRCSEPRAAERMRLFAREIEWEWERRDGQKMLIHIFDQGFKTHR